MVSVVAASGVGALSAKNQRIQVGDSRVE